MSQVNGKEEVKESQFDLNQVKNQVKEALVENKKKKRGGKRHKKDKKEFQDILQKETVFESNKKSSKPET